MQRRDWKKAGANCNNSYIFKKIFDANYDSTYTGDAINDFGDTDSLRNNVMKSLRRINDIRSKSPPDQKKAEKKSDKKSDKKTKKKID